MVAQSVIHTSATIGEDRKLVIQLPPDTPTGQVAVDLVLRADTAEIDAVPENSERERIRAALLAKGLLSTAHDPPEDMIFPTDEEIYQAGIMPPGARPSEAILREIRDEED